MTSTPLIRVLLVDDHAVFRESLAVRLSAEPDLAVVGEAAGAEAAIEQARTCEPDIVLMDIDMAGLSPFAAAGKILAGRSRTRVVFLSAFSHDVYIEQAIRARAWGYLTKSEPFATVCRAIRDVARGWVHFSPEIKDRIVNSPEGPRLAARATTRLSQLSARETEVLRLLAEGMSARRIAETLQISTKTVDNHKSHLMAKLGIHDRVELARYAYREGLVTL